MTALEQFSQGYVACALWSSMDHADDTGGEPLDQNYDIDDIDAGTLAAMQADCKDFLDTNLKELNRAPAWYNFEQAGHDFWLTRNGHGAGFWDRGLGDIGQRLTEASKVYGGVDLYIGDDEKIYA